MSPTFPKTGPLEDANRAERREVQLGRPTGPLGDRTFVGILSKPERLAIARVAQVRVRAHARTGAPRYAHPQARRISRLARQMEASRIAHELYPVIDRARGIHR